MYLHCEFETPVDRGTPGDYVRKLLITVKAYDADLSEAYTVGKLAMKQILWAQALADGMSLYEICDNDSQELNELHAILTDGEEDTFRPEVETDEITSHVMFLHAAVFHPVVHRFRKAILDAAFNLFGVDTLGVMWQETTGYSPSQLWVLGFKKIAGESLFYRHAALPTPFSRRHPQGQEADVQALPEHEAWVNAEWNNLMGVTEEEEDETPPPPLNAGGEGDRSG
jgi:hypothetical protein